MSSSDLDLSRAVGDMARFFMLTAILDIFFVGGIDFCVRCVVYVLRMRGVGRTSAFVRACARRTNNIPRRR